MLNGTQSERDKYTHTLTYIQTVLTEHIHHHSKFNISNSVIQFQLCDSSSYARMKKESDWMVVCSFVDCFVVSVSTNTRIYDLLVVVHFFVLLFIFELWTHFESLIDLLCKLWLMWSSVKNNNWFHFSSEFKNEKKKKKKTDRIQWHLPTKNQINHLFVEIYGWSEVIRDKMQWGRIGQKKKRKIVNDFHFLKKIAKKPSLSLSPFQIDLVYKKKPERNKRSGESDYFSSSSYSSWYTLFWVCALKIVLHCILVDRRFAY